MYFREVFLIIMKNRFITALLVTSLVCAAVMTGCGSKESAPESAASSAEESSEESSSEEEVSEESALSSEETAFSEEEAAPEDSVAETEEYPTMTPTEENVFDPGFEPETIMDENYDPTVVEDPVIPESPDGEGAISFTGQKVNVSADTAAAEIGKDYTVNDASGNALYTIRIDSMENTEKRSDFEEEAANVILVNYTVTSQSAADPVFVGASGFRLTDENGTAFRSYEFDPEAMPSTQIAPLAKGETGSFSIAYAVDQAPSALSLVFGDPEGADTWQYKLEASSDLLAGLK